ncbi:protein LURP-one-related 5-like [Silene latifolia]|uniref:protein LURP-one-related 5-like n=1 Tax=Silene latifolia TaxID=37657 RepID=UPI003D7730BC
MNLSQSNGGFTCEKDTILTVCKTSLFFTGDGFTVYDCHGQLVFRVDSYGPDWRDREELVLMDASGHCLLTVRRKRPSLHNRWEGYLGERTEGSKPIFSVKRASIIGRSGVTVEMYENAGEEYQIEGSFTHRSCTIYDASSREVMGEIRRKVDASANVVLGKDVFSLIVKPGFDAAFAMGLVLVLDQINTEGLADVLGSADVYDSCQVDPASPTMAL